MADFTWHQTLTKKSLQKRLELANETKEGDSIMKTVTINDEAAPLLKQGLDLEKRILESSYNRYDQELEGFEKQHAMSTEEFVAGFNSGNLGDDAEWFDWLFAYKALGHVEKKLNVIEGISL